jgi:hypothetical protein
MNKMIVFRKFLEGALAGALMSAGALTVVPGDANYWAVLLTALGTGAIRGGLNAWKHL